MTLLHGLFGLHRHKQSQIYGTQETAPGSPNENGVYGLVKNFTNAEGAAVSLGDVVKRNGAESIQLTETLLDPDVLGVVAGVGPYANGATVPVLIMGYHPAVKVTGAAAVGAYLTSSATDGTAQVLSPGAKGAFARTTAAAAAGVAPAIVFQVELGGDVENFLDLADVPSDYTGDALKTLRVNATETGIEFSAPAASAFTSLTDVPASYATHGGEAVRVNVGATGLEFVTFPSSGSIEYDPKRAPASPSALNDEFDDLSLAAKWTTGSSGVGSSGTVNETDRKGFVHTNVTDGGSGSARWIDQSPAVAIAAGEWTIMARVFGNVANAGSNQMNIELYGGATLRFACGMLNGTQAIINGPAGFTAHNRTYITGNVGEMWLIIQHDAGTGIDGWVSKDGMIWTRLTGMTSAGTITLIRLVAVAFSSSNAEGWWDCFRYFPGVRTFTIGGTP